MASGGVGTKPAIDSVDSLLPARTAASLWPRTEDPNLLFRMVAADVVEGAPGIQGGEVPIQVPSGPTPAPGERLVATLPPTRNRKHMPRNQQLAPTPLLLLPP